MFGEASLSSSAAYAKGGHIEIPSVGIVKAAHSNKKLFHFIIGPFDPMCYDLEV